MSLSIMIILSENLMIAPNDHDDDNHSAAADDDDDHDVTDGDVSDSDFTSSVDFASSAGRR